jgi:multidrug resistance efflux pump
MAVAMIAIWLGFLQLLVMLKILKRWTLWMKLSPLIIYLAVLLVIFIPMNFGAPVGGATVVKNSVEIAPAVSGYITDVIVVPGSARVSAGDTLFHINAVPFDSRVRELEAQLDLAKIRQGQAAQLVKKQAGRVGDVQKYDAEVKQLEAQLARAKQDLEFTEVRAPVAGYIPILLLREGTWVNAGAPLLRLIESTDNYLAVQIDQVNLRHVKAGQSAEVILKLYPGKVFNAEVVNIVQASQDGLWDPSSNVRQAADTEAEPIWVTVKLLDDVQLPAGTVGQATIFTEKFGKSHVIRQIMLRMDTWLNFVKP